MANRIIYQSDSLFVSQAVNSNLSGQHVQLDRVQSANYSFNINRTDVNQFGQLARIDSVVLESPTISVDVSYLLGDGFNEEVLGFSRSKSFSDAESTGFISKQISATSSVGTSGINLYILTAPEGIDSNLSRGAVDKSDYSVIGLGNCYLSDYTLDCSVGDFPTVSVSFEGLNANATTDVTGITGIAGVSDDEPAATSMTGFTGISGVGVDPTNGTQLAIFQGASNKAIAFPAPSTGSSVGIAALKPGDITLSLSQADTKSFYTIGGGTTGAHVQSLSLNVPLSRTPIEKLGSTFAFARVADFPITPTVSISAVVNEQNQNAIHDIIQNDGFISEMEFGVVQGGNIEAQDKPGVRYKLKNLKLDSESVSSSIGPNKTVDMTFSVSIGGPEDNDNNVFFSGLQDADFVHGNGTPFNSISEY